MSTEWVAVLTWKFESQSLCYFLWNISRNGIHVSRVVSHGLQTLSDEILLSSTSVVEEKRTHNLCPIQSCLIVGSEEWDGVGTPLPISAAGKCVSGSDRHHFSPQELADFLPGFYWNNCDDLTHSTQLTPPLMPLWVRFLSHATYPSTSTASFLFSLPPPWTQRKVIFEHLISSVIRRTRLWTPNSVVM